jgi:hypothetical protein
MRMAHSRQEVRPIRWTPVQDWLRRNLGAVWSVPGADVESAGGDRREIDVLALSRTEVIVAEVTGSVAGMTPEAIRSSLDLASSLGADRLVLATLDAWMETDRPLPSSQISGRELKLTTLDITDLTGD